MFLLVGSAVTRPSAFRAELIEVPKVSNPPGPDVMSMSSSARIGSSAYSHCLMPFPVPIVATRQTRSEPSAPLPLAFAPVTAHCAPTSARDAETTAALAGATVMVEAISAKADAAITNFFTMSVPDFRQLRPSPTADFFLPPMGRVYYDFDDVPAVHVQKVNDFCNEYDIDEDSKNQLLGVAVQFKSKRKTSSRKSARKTSRRKSARKTSRRKSARKISSRKSARKTSSRKVRKN